jgi:anhydro-N-acetylmuramic acid kinase
MERLFGRGFDRNGATAGRGRVLEDVLKKLMRARYFSAPPPKSCGREEYGDAFVAQFIAA